MNNKKISNQRYNKHKSDVNKMINENNKAIKALIRVNEKYKIIDNISEIYMNKVYEIYNNLHKQSIDFWSNDFLLREAILFHLKTKTIESRVHLSIILEKILLLPNITIKNKVLNDLTFKSMNKEIKEIENIKNYIKKYDFKVELQETMIEYFSNIPVEIIEPNDIKKIYHKMKENIETLNLQESLKKDTSLIEIINQKEKECLEYKEKEAIIKKELYEFLMKYYKNEPMKDTKVKKL